MIKNKLKIGLVAIFVAVFGLADIAGAASLAYSNDTTVDLSNPDIDLTIKAGSEATSLVVNAGNIVVEVPSGSVFVITSASRGLGSGGFASGVTVSQTCNSSQVDTLTITASSGSGTYTITPASSKCTYSSGGGGGGGGGGSTTPTTPAVPTSTTGEVTATASGGGLVSKSNADGTSAKVELPANAVSSATTVTVAPVAKATAITSRPAPAGSSMVGDYVYNFTAVTGTTSVASFSKALTITLTYTDAQVAGLSEGTLKIHYWDETSSKWVALGDSVIDSANNKITATTNHFTYFAILATQEETSVPETPTAPAQNIIDGDIIQCKSCSNPFAVYIVKIVGNTKYVRHIVSIEIFNYYRHLKWENLKQVSSLNGYSLSGWVRYNTGANNTAGPTDKVYEINGDQTKHWINMTAQQFLSHGGSDAAIYSVNEGELNLYTKGPDVMSL